ncbi:vegetative cell wall protein gp1-like [Arachis ipaensis]|uniref:vegetative cell wall protein gp1-like n=1 Tax=Arachis ipaensis TaxID=130454 RepID=UPI0007AF2AE5|nr:vegetative cell wall protein gp1-like [Arachis ipaensis]
MRKKTIIRKSPKAKFYKLPDKPKTSPRSKDQTFTPSSFPPTSPPRTDPMAHTKITPRYPSLSKPMAPPSAPSQPSTSKEKCPAAEEPPPKLLRPKPRSAPQRPQRGNPHLPLKPVKKPSIDPFEHKSQFMTSHSNYNPHRFCSAMNHDFYEDVVVHRTICLTFLTDLPTLKKKDFIFANNL